MFDLPTCHHRESNGQVRHLAERRRARRLPVPGACVTVESPDFAAEAWMVSAIDISADGLGLALPPQLEPGRRVELTFELGGARFERLPGILVRRWAGAGAVELGPLADDDRQRLAAVLS